MSIDETQIHIPQMALFVDPADGSCSAPGFSRVLIPEESLPLPTEMLDLFEQMTGWVVEFQETRHSYKKRQLPSLTPPEAIGAFEIVDMSTAWPADRPTSHRAKCDRFFHHVNSLVANLQLTKSELVKTQSTIAAYSSQAIEDEEAMLVDSFIPRYGDQRTGDRRQGDRRTSSRRLENPDSEPRNRDSQGSQGAQETAPTSTFVDDIYSSDFIVVERRPTAEDNRAEPSPSRLAAIASQWTIGGAPGFDEGRYIDWQLNSPDPGDGPQVDLIVGRIEQPNENGSLCTTGPTDSDGHHCTPSESILCIDPRTHTFLLEGKLGHAFWLLNCAGDKITLIAPSPDSRQIQAGQALVVTTSGDPKLEALRSSLVSDPLPHRDREPTPDEIAQEIQRRVGDAASVLVLKRNAQDSPRG